MLEFLRTEYNGDKVKKFLSALILLCFVTPHFAGADWRSDAEAEKKQIEEEKRNHERGLMFTIYQNPDTGVEFKTDALSFYAGWYPARLRTEDDGPVGLVKFFKIGIRHYFSNVGSAFYISAAEALSMNQYWDNALVFDGGYRWNFFRFFDVRAGVGMLFTATKTPRIDLNIGLGIWGFVF